MIVLRDVSFSFGDKAVLRDFSCTFGEGEITLVMGPSGCGKSTLLSLLAGECKPQRGEITGLPGRVGVAFQTDLLVPALTVLDNLRLVMPGRPRAELIRALEELGLGDETDTRAGTLSGGMARRVSLCRAVLFDAPVLLLDEPFRGLDEDSRARAVRFILGHRAGRTLICVTHDPEDERYLVADKVIRMEEAKRP